MQFGQSQAWHDTAPSAFGNCTTNRRRACRGSLDRAGALCAVYVRREPGRSVCDRHRSAGRAGDRPRPPADFAVSEDGTRQAITAFAAGEFPLAVAIGLDRSFSMADKRTALASPSRRRAPSSARCGQTDQVMVVAIGGEIEVASPLSTDRAAALAAIDRLDAWGTTPLYDAALVGARRDSVRPRTPRAGAAVGRHRSIQRHGGRGSGRSGAATRRADLSDRARARAAAGVRRARCGDRRPVVPRAASRASSRRR